MMEKKRQEDIIRQEICNGVRNGEDNITKIYDIIEKYHGIPRPTIRKFAHSYRKELQKRVTILSSNIKESLVIKH